MLQCCKNWSLKSDVKLREGTYSTKSSSSTGKIAE